MRVPCNGAVPAYAMPGMPRGQAAPFGRDGRLAQPGHGRRMRACTGIPRGQTGLGGMIQGLLDWGVGGGIPVPSRQASRPWAPRLPLASKRRGGLTWGRRRGAGETKDRQLYWVPALEGDPWA